GVVLGPDALDRAAGILKMLPQPFTVSDARRALGTTRRVAVPLLEQLDARRITRRGDEGTRTLTPTPSGVDTLSVRSGSPRGLPTAISDVDQRFTGIVGTQVLCCVGEPQARRI